MKKLLFAVAALFACVGMNAQFWAGGSLGFNMTKYDYDGAKSQTDIKFAPTLGYALDDQLEVGLSLGYTANNNVSGSNLSLSTISIMPFVRYTVLSEGKVSIFVDGQVAYEKYSDEYQASPDFNRSYYVNPISYFRSASDGSQFKAGVAPGVKVALSDELTLASTLGFFGFSHHNGVDGGTVNNTRFGVDINTAVSFGLYYSF